MRATCTRPYLLWTIDKAIGTYTATLIIIGVSKWIIQDFTDILNNSLVSNHNRKQIRSSPSQETPPQLRVGLGGEVYHWAKCALRVIWMLTVGTRTFQVTEVYLRPIYECRCDERLKAKAVGSTRLAYTGLRGGLEHPKIETRLIDESFESVMGGCVF